MKKTLFLFTSILISSFSYSQDLSVTSISTPSDACQLTNSESIFVFVWNSGPGSHGGLFSVNYSLNNGPTVTATSATTIAFNAVFNFTFPIPEDFSACQLHNLKIWVESGLDSNPANDTLFTTVISDCPAVPGTISGPANICEGINDDTLFLNGYTGNVLAWESSPDGIAWTNYPTTNDFYNFTNLPATTIWRAIVDSPFGICGADTTNWFTVSADQQSDAGVLPADFNICDNGNSGWVYTSGFTGSILDWNLSTNFGGSWIPLSSPSDSLAFSNLLNTTQYQVIVQNGVCPPDTSAMINLTLIQGSSAGTISGPSVVCNFENNDSLVACCGNGTVIAWNVSLDNGITWQPTTDVDSVFEFSNLSSNVLLQAVWQFGSCPIDTANYPLTVLPVITVITPDTTINEGDVINLNVCCGQSYLWWPIQFLDDANSQTPIVDPNVDITYFVQVTSVQGCKDTARVNITVLPDLTTLEIPNLLTPNSDGFNDFWEIGNIQAYAKNELTIFNIYGQVVYEAAPYNNDWAGTFEGKNLPDGTYFYLFQLNDPLFVEPIQGTLTLTAGE
jgi:gliding motility-associated-like protein